jgi:hypothetical protein
VREDAEDGGDVPSRTTKTLDDVVEINDSRAGII